MNVNRMIGCCCIVVLVLLSAFILVFLPDRSPHNPQDWHSRVASAISADVLWVAETTGVVYRNESQYLRSAFAQPIRSQTGSNAVRFELLVVEYGGSDHFTIVVTVHDRVGGERRPATSLELSGRQLAFRQLRSATSGTGWWRGLLSNIRVGNVVPSHTTISMPELRFHYPGNQSELAQYRQWLVTLLGSDDMLVDDWGHPIKLSLDGRSNPPILIAGSAGPDGKWGTKDDMVLKRDTKTGRIIEEIGFGAASAQPSAK